MLPVSDAVCEAGYNSKTRPELCRIHLRAMTSILQESTGQIPMLPNSMPDLDKLMSALFLVALLLYLVPAVFRLGESRQWFQGSAILTLGTAIAIAVVASVIWFVR